MPPKKSPSIVFNEGVSLETLDTIEGTGPDAKIVSPKSSSKKQVVDAEIKKQIRSQLSDIGDGKIGVDILHFVKSRYKVLYICSSEERRVIKLFKDMSVSEGYNLFQWDCSRGLLDSGTMKQVKTPNNEVHESPVAVLSHILDQAKDDNAKMKDDSLMSEGHIFMLLDFHLFLGSDCHPDLQRKFKEFTAIDSVCCIVVVAPQYSCPVSLEKEFTVVDFPYPSKTELKKPLGRILDALQIKHPKAAATGQARQDDLLHAAAGLTMAEAENAYALSIVKHKDFNISTILNEKKQIIRKSGVLEYRDPKFSFDDVGGLDNLKNWLNLRKLAFSEDALKYGLTTPKGLLMCGIQGCGKSLVAEALARYWEMPLLRLDIGSIFSSHVGDSERNTRDATKIASAVAPAILWIDEVEKGIGGVQSSNQTDGGVTNRVFGTLLTWMQEKTEPVFVVCTANNVSGIPPEFLRAGRFDEIFFVDLPNEEQRVDVTKKIFARKKRNAADFNTLSIAKHSENYSPAEIEKAINNGMFIAFSDGGRQVTTDDVINEIHKFQPLYNSRRTEIEEMRSWALGEDGKGGFAVLANSIAADKTFLTQSVKRNIDISDD